MQPHDGQLKRFRLNTEYPHNRSEGTTRRKNKGTRVMEEQREAYEESVQADLGDDF